MAKDDKKLLLEAQEIKLVKILAGNNKKLRDRTVKRLNKWLIDRNEAAPLTDEALMRIWKGLFYAMWMSDKPLIQEDCAEKIAHLVHLNSAKSSLMFFKCFLQTMVNEWFGIDQHRIDKFMMLTRRIFRQTFEVLNQEGWQDEHITEFREILNQTALKVDNNTCLGLCLHIDDIFLEELAKVSKGQISGDKLIELIQPFAQQLSRLKDSRQLQHITNHIFKHLINQTDIAIDYKEKFHAWRRQGFPGGTLDSMETIPLENEDFAEDDVHEDLGDLPKDPRAGKIDVVLPQLQFDPIAVVNLLEDLKFKKYTTSDGRKNITKLIKHFKVLAEGVYPYGLTKINIPDNPKPSIKSSVKSLQKFEETLTHDSKKAKSKALRRKKAKEFLLQQINQQETDEKQKKTETIEEFINKSEGHLFSPQNKTQSKKKQNEDQNKTKSKKKQENQKKAETIEESPKKRKLEGDITPKKNKKMKIPGEIKEKLIPIRQNHFKRNSGMWTVDEYEAPESPQVGKPHPSKKSEWEKPLKNGETEIFVVSKKSKKKLKRLAESKNRPIHEIVDNFTQKIMNGTPKKANVVKNPFSENTTPKSEKKIKFSNKIHAQEFKDHQQNIIKSPIIPYDGTKKPTKSLLKPSPFSSPINPFYKLNSKIKNV